MTDARRTNKDRDLHADIAQGAPTKTLEKGLFLLGLFDHDHPEWTLRELRERAGLPKATTRRLMKTLEASNWVGLRRRGRQLPPRVRRAQGPLPGDVPQRARRGSSTRIWSASWRRPPRPPSSPSGPTRGLSSSTRCPPRARSSRSRSTACCSKAWPAPTPWRSSPSAPKRTGSASWPGRSCARTANTVTDPQALREKWSAIRREGVAFDWLEWNADAPAVAVPLFDRRGHLLGALSIVVPIERASRRGHAEPRERCSRSAAAEISQKLG